MATSPEPEATSIPRRSLTASGWSSRYRASACPPAQANAQKGGSRPVRPAARSVRCHTPIGSLAWYSRISGTNATERSLVLARTISSSLNAMREVWALPDVGDEDVGGGGEIEFDPLLAGTDPDEAAGPAHRHLGVRPESSPAQLGQQRRVGLDRLADPAHHHAASRLGHLAQCQHAAEELIALVVAELGEPGDRVSVRRFGGMAEDVKHPEFHGLAHHVPPPARLVVDQLPVQAEDVGEQALGEPVLAHHPRRGRASGRSELD